MQTSRGKHEHDWIEQDWIRPYRDRDGKQFIQDIYICDKCGAGGFVRTPLEMFNKGLRKSSIDLAPPKQEVDGDE